jgi:hypothetical protein
VRADGIAGRVTGEVVLVLRQGLLAWVRAGPGDAPAGSGEPRPAAIDHGLVAAFVELILNRRPEGPS